MTNPSGDERIETKAEAELPRRWHGLSARGAWVQFALAVVLISVLPLLVFIYLLIGNEYEITMSSEMVRIIMALDVFFVVLGYALLIKYPVDIVRLRRCLKALAKGALPKKVELLKDESDLAAIESYMTSIITQTEERVRTIETQTAALVEAERQRVMIESLGAACHHLGQPATVIDLYLSMMGEKEESPEMQELIRRCQESSKAMASVIRKLQTMTEYRTEVYRSLSESEPPRTDVRILKI